MALQGRRVVILIEISLGSFLKVAHGLWDLLLTDYRLTAQVTLHNSALLHESGEAAIAVDKLAHLLARSGDMACPPSTLSNMALLLCRSQREQEAAELLERHREGPMGSAVSEVSPQNPRIYILITLHPTSC